jgi:hypothetical protein
MQPITPSSYVSVVYVIDCHFGLSHLLPPLPLPLLGLPIALDAAIQKLPLPLLAVISTRHG